MDIVYCIIFILCIINITFNITDKNFAAVGGWFIAALGWYIII